MTDLERLLESAVADVRGSVRRETSSSFSVIVRRARRRMLIVAAASVFVVGLVSAALLTVLGSDDSVPPADSDGAITSEMILEDGVVTETEYRAGVGAVVACVAEAGIEVEADFDDPSRHASFLQRSGSGGEMQRCMEIHLSDNVSLGWAAMLGQVNLDELREQTMALVGCVERHTGENFGEASYDSFGYLTEEGQRTRDAAFEYQDHEPWLACQNELGYLAALNAKTTALVECVEEKTGQDFGEVTFDESGQLTEEGQIAVQAAGTYQQNVPWNTCQQELGPP